MSSIRRLLVVLLVAVGPVAAANTSPAEYQRNNLALLGMGRQSTGVATLPTDTNQTFLSNIDWTVATNGWGPPEKDTSNGENVGSDGATITLNSLTYSKGLGVHAPSVLRYALNKTCTSFRAVIGVDDEAGMAGSIVFKVLANGSQRAAFPSSGVDNLARAEGGTVLYTSPTMTGASASISINVDVTNVFELVLQVTDAADGITSDHGDWGYARAICVSPSGTRVNAGDNVQTALTGGSTNQSFLLGTGRHLVSSLAFKNGQKLYGELGTILWGGKALTSYNATTCGGTPCWYYTGQTQGTPGTSNTTGCWSTAASGYTDYYPCGNAEVVYYDDIPLVPVTVGGNQNSGASGRFYFDYSADRIYIYDDPVYHTVETSVQTHPFTGSTTGNEFHNLTIEEFTGGVDIGTGWLLADSEVRFSSRVFTNTSVVVRDSYVHHMAFEGFAGAGSTITVQDTEVSYNNTQFNNPYNEGGGSKWVFTDNLIVQRNNSHHNFGPGFWTDIDNYSCTYDSNTIEDNDRAGIFHEISYACTMSNNTISRNGFLEASFNAGWGAGIQIANSKNVEIYGNTLKANAQGITGQQDDSRNCPLCSLGTREVLNLNVHDNSVCQLVNYGALLSASASYYLAPANNHWTHNTYSGPGSSGLYYWGSDKLFTQWQAIPQDASGSHSTATHCP